MRNIKIAPNEHYHIFNRGVGKQTIFHDKSDYVRFLFLIVHFQSSVTFLQIGRLSKKFLYDVQHRVLDKEIEQDIVKNRSVELVSFCLMPNHFHLLIKELEDTGIATYMQRILNAYTKYYNTKYEKSGHLFQGPYKTVHIEDDKQLLYLSAYIHRNPRELKEWHGKEKEYPWSSYEDFVKENRFGKLLVPDIVLEQFKSTKEYQRSLDTSTAKMFEEQLAEVTLE